MCSSVLWPFLIVIALGVCSGFVCRDGRAEMFSLIFCNVVFAFLNYHHMRLEESVQNLSSSLFA